MIPGLCNGALEMRRSALLRFYTCLFWKNSGKSQNCSQNTHPIPRPRTKYWISQIKNMNFSVPYRTNKVIKM
jgi:hypothetical protein